MATPSCSFANLLTGNKLGSKRFRDLVAVMHLKAFSFVVIVSPLQATKVGFLREVLHDHIFFTLLTIRLAKF